MTWEDVERTVGPAGSVDLITVAQALHWFDFDEFFALAKKVRSKAYKLFGFNKLCPGREK